MTPEEAIRLCQEAIDERFEEVADLIEAMQKEIILLSPAGRRYENVSPPGEPPCEMPVRESTDDYDGPEDHFGEPEISNAERLSSGQIKPR